MVNLKKYMLMLAVGALFTAGFTRCSDWTEVEALNKDTYDNTEPSRPEAYYEALRAYKKTDHALSFGWFSSWGNPGASVFNSLVGLPDSMDLVSIWDNSINLSQSKMEDLRIVQQKKGTKVLMCTFIQWVGKGFTPPEYDTDQQVREEFWGWVDGDESAIKASMDKYSRAIVDTLNKYGYDGLDIDFEPYIDGVVGKLDENPTYVTWFLDILSQYLGPRSNSGKMLVIDGEIYNVPPSTGPYFDYLIAQAYSVSSGTPPPTAGGSEANMDSRLTRVINRFDGFLTPEEVTKRFIITENLESAIDALNGGYFWTPRGSARLDKEVCPSLLGMALWMPANGYRKGGFGGYRFDAESINKPSYKWMRRGIQAQNPAVN